MIKITGFSMINSDVGKKIAYTYSVIDEDGNITKSNMRGSYAVVDEIVLESIAIIETDINTRITE